MGVLVNYKAVRRSFRTFGSSIGSALIGFIQSGTGAEGRTAQDKMRDWVSVKDFGAVGDYTTDDTAAVHAAFDYCIENRRALYVPVGRYRVTSGYTNSTTKDLAILGANPAYNAPLASTDGGSCFVLDSVDAASFFFLQSASNELLVDKVRFVCAQTVTDRKFFRVNASSVKHTFNEVSFGTVEQPFVFEAGCYMQMSSYRNIRFTNSGSFHSKVNTLLGTLLVIDNCDVEGFIPANTEKVVCNLSGFRHIQGRNFLIEPGLPATGWTALKIDCAFGAGWARYPNAAFYGLYIECTAFEPDYVVDVVGNHVRINDSHMNLTPTSRVRISDQAHLDIDCMPMNGSVNYKMDTLFTFGDTTSRLTLRGVNTLNLGAAVEHPQITIENATGGSAAPAIGVTFNNLRSQVLWEFDGGYPNSGLVQATTFSGGSQVPSTDATYGRKLVLTPSGGGDFNEFYQARLRARLSEAGQVWIALVVKLPTYTGGSVAISFVVDSVTLGTGATYDSTFSGQTVTLLRSFNAGSTAAVAGFRVSGTITGFAGSAEVYYAAIGVGRTMPNVPVPCYPATVNTSASAVPTTGTWAVGDYCKNSAPAVGQPKGWYCTVAGTPGTWVSEGNL
jgi:hypothetical protein